MAYTILPVFVWGAAALFATSYLLLPTTGLVEKKIQVQGSCPRVLEFVAGKPYLLFLPHEGSYLSYILLLPRFL